MVISYAVDLMPDDGTVLVTSTAFPELTTYGEDEDEAMVRAKDALEEAIAARMDDGADVPAPSSGRHRVALPPLTAAKVVLYQEMKRQRVGKAELARLLGWRLPRIDRVLDVQHRSRLDHIAAALDAVGRRLEVA